MGIREGYEHLTEKEIRFSKALDGLNVDCLHIAGKATKLADDLGLTQKEAAVIFAGWAQAIYLQIPELPAKPTHPIVCPDCGEVDAVVSTYDGGKPVAGECPKCETDLFFA